MALPYGLAAGLAVMASAALAWALGRGVRRGAIPVGGGWALTIGGALAVFLIFWQGLPRLYAQDTIVGAAARTGEGSQAGDFAAWASGAVFSLPMAGFFVLTFILAGIIAALLWALILGAMTAEAGRGRGGGTP